ncbi:MAG: GNAT family N-acetyltransferase [Acidobacteria bacterium]|nr:GNAT family N-acetyltransferase [Acidobacteriota bacterium]
MKKKSASAKSLRLRFLPATKERWADLEALFGERGACGGCWCMAWRLPRAQYQAGKGEKNRRALMKLVKSKQAPGILAYAGRQAIGWCAVAPRSDYSFLGRSRVLQEVDALPVWSISCLFVLRAYRGQGVSTELLRAAVLFAAARGAQMVEGYPTIPYGERVPAAFLWTGTWSAFLQAGFTEVARRSSGRPIMRAAAAARR